LVIGEDEEKRFIANALKQHPANYLVMGYADLPYLLRQRRIHEIVVAGNTKPELESNLFQLLSDCRAEGVRVSQVPDLYERLYHSTPIKYIDSSWALGAVQHLPVFGFLPTAVKRLMDVVLGLAGLLVFMLVLPVVALAIRLDSPGAIFYRQIRCGRAGKPFSIIKFRTMYSDAEKDGRPRWATRNDDRITRVGRFLRKTRLDEVPQVINVLLGEMSVIGPRPERPEFVKDLQQSIPFYRTRLMVKPGLTGWAQINYPYGNTVDDALIKLQYDFYHLRHWSVWLDLYILFRTFSVMLRFKGT
jgi:exopolysaccharide biosynthesis polyprenyl glycosylphosphotransferase